MLLACAAAFAQNPKRMDLPKLTFSQPRLQELDAHARTRYADPEDVNPFEIEQAKRWKGKEWELMVLNYFLCVYASQDQPTEDGEVLPYFTDAEVERVESAMLSRYFEAKGIEEPFNVTALYNLVEERVNSIVEETEFLGDGPMWHINFYAHMQHLFTRYLAQRLAYELRANGDHDDDRWGLTDEEAAFRNYAKGLSNVYLNGLLAENENLYYSMLPLEVSCFGIDVEESRIESLKRLSPMIGDESFSVEQISPAVAQQWGADFNTLLEAYAKTIKEVDVDKQVRKLWSQELNEAIQYLNEFLSKRDVTAEEMNEENRKFFENDSMYYVELLVKALRGESYTFDDEE